LTGSVTETRARQRAPCWCTAQAVAGLYVMADAGGTLDTVADGSRPQAG
jgi:hypothetical protein